MVMAGTDGVLPLPDEYGAVANRQGAKFKRSGALEYSRSTVDFAKVEQKGRGKLVIINPHCNATTATWMDEDGRSVVISDTNAFNTAIEKALVDACRNSFGDENVQCLCELRRGEHHQHHMLGHEGISKRQKILALQDRILDDATERKLRKCNGFVYEPLPGKPCAYRPTQEYFRHIAELFGEDEILRSSPDNHGKLVNWLTMNECLVRFPEYEADNDLIGFDNGVLDIVAHEFHANDDIVEGHPLYGKSARHHINKVWTGSDHTPVLDRILDH
eukprot:scaffold83541_cov25-Prasinocladus_malaysianus.AAC.2